jgi:tetratricopeptide (TPR) repeat protein
MHNLQLKQEPAQRRHLHVVPAEQVKTSPKRYEISRLLDRAVALHRSGKPADAETICLELLKQKPDHFDAIHLLAVLQVQMGRPCEAVTSYSRAIALRPGDAVALNNCGAALSQLKRFDEALASYDRALAIRPKYGEALSNRGTALLELGRFEAAITNFEQSLALTPDDASTLFRHAAALSQLNRDGEALASLHHALAVKPDLLEALELRGGMLVKLGRFDEALSSFDRALGIKPNRAAALANRGLALTELKRLDEALASYEKAIALKRNFPEVHNNRGIALQQLGQYEEAVASLDEAIALKPDYADAYNNRGNALREIGRVEEALASYERAIACRPNYFEAFSNRGNALADLGLSDSALASYDRSIEICCEHADHRFNRSLLLLRLGRFGEGWREYEWRRKKKDWSEPQYGVPKWSGESLSGKHVVLHCEQGLGDSIQFARFAQTIVRRGARVTVAAPANLVALLERLEGDITIISDGAELQEVNLQLPLMSVPFVLGLEEGDIPADVPYLSADQARTELWASRLPSDGFRVGIAWQGNPKPRIDKGRSIPLKAFAPLCRLPGVRLISLQKDAGMEQLSDLPAGMTVESLGADFDSGPDAFLDTAAVMMNLDLIITSDTAVAHLAGALGRPVWIALKRVPDWRWQLDREDSPWYPTARLFRQTRAGNWDEVFQRIANELARLSPEQPSRPTDASVVSIPVPIGELVDKITILRIKSERIGDPKKLANVQRELALLNEVRRRCTSRDGMAALESELEAINCELWDIEDRIRDCEHKSDFGEEFVELARAVYKSNDQRSVVKRRISELAGSTLIEEKSYH